MGRWSNRRRYADGWAVGVLLPQCPWLIGDVIGGVAGGLVVDGVGLSCFDGMWHWDGITICMVVIHFSSYGAITSLQLECNQIAHSLGIMADGREWVLTWVNAEFFLPFPVRMSEYVIKLCNSM